MNIDKNLLDQAFFLSEKDDVFSSPSFNDARIEKVEHTRVTRVLYNFIAAADLR